MSAGKVTVSIRFTDLPWLLATAIEAWEIAVDPMDETARSKRIVDLKERVAEGPPR